MKLLGDFFNILDKVEQPAGFSVILHFNPDHSIYANHFPGFPVTPGVVLLQIVTELLELQLGKPVQLQTMPQCKFLKIVVPGAPPRLAVQVVFEEIAGLLQVQAQGEWDNEVYFRLRAVFRF